MRSLRAKIALVLLASVFATFSILTFIQAIRDQRQHLAAQRDVNVAVTGSLAESLGREGLARADRLRVLIKSYVRSKSIRHIRVLNRDYRVIAASNPRNAGRLYRTPDVQEPVEHGITAVTISRAIWTPVLRVTAPVRQGSRLIGALEVEFTLPPAQAGLWPFVRQAAPVSLVMTGVLTLALMWPLTLIVVRPITRFAQLSHDLERGNLLIEIPNQGADELGQLGRTLVKTRDSLRELNKLQNQALRRTWKDENHLSGLPGNQAVQRELRRRLDSGEGFVALYADLDSLTAFNGRYGLERGDQVIRFTARTLQETLRTYGGLGDFVGHVGGGDFVLIVNPRRANTVAQAAVHAFEAGVLDFYDGEDLERGYIMAKDNEAGLGQLPLAGLTIVGVPVAARHASIFKIDEAAAELKATAKRQPGSKFVIEQNEAVRTTHPIPHSGLESVETSSPETAL